MLIYVDCALIREDSCLVFADLYWCCVDWCRFILILLWIVMIYV